MTEIIVALIGAIATIAVAVIRASSRDDTAEEFYPDPDFYDSEEGLSDYDPDLPVMMIVSTDDEGDYYDDESDYYDDEGDYYISEQ